MKARRRRKGFNPGPNGYILGSMYEVDMDIYQAPRSSGLPLNYFDGQMSVWDVLKRATHAGALLSAFALGLLVAGVL